MKRNILFILLFLLPAIISMAQRLNGCQMLVEGKSWNYTYTYREIDNEGNLVMKTVDYREWIEGTEVRNGQTYFLLHNSENSNTVVLCREDGGRMYALYDNASEEQQVYDFNLFAGSNIDWGFPGFYVSSTDSIEVDGICRKRLYINHATEDYTTGVCVWVEGVGNTGLLLEPFGHPFSDGKQYTLLSCYEGENCIFEAEDFDAVSNGGSNGVKSVKKDSPLKSSAFYDLQGRRLNRVGAGPVPARLRKGVYIENGRKRVVK